MKHVLILFIFVLTIVAEICVAKDIQVTFATGEWPPFTSKELPEYGVVTELVSAICRANGIQPVYMFYPWPRAEDMLKNGEVFAAFPYAITKERKVAFNFSEVLFYGSNVFVYYEKNPKTPAPVPYEEIEDLKEYEIGGLRGSFLETNFEQKGLTYNATTTIDQSVRKLVTGRIDFLIDNQVVIFDIIKRLYPDDIEYFKTLPKPFGRKMATALMVSRSYPEAQEILKKFNKGLMIIKQNGEYDRITKKYHMTKAE
ncbi:MAG: amino acid ABC transporter substrate-binding protein [Desulfobacteraceae bacterium]|nr:amino acid ABC transporter substrate-binding protein [Desulfobacteraceae bacterium]